MFQDVRTDVADLAHMMHMSCIPCETLVTRDAGHITSQGLSLLSSKCFQRIRRPCLAVSDLEGCGIDTVFSGHNCTSHFYDKVAYMLFRNLDDGCPSNMANAVCAYIREIVKDRLALAIKFKTIWLDPLTHL